MSTSLNVTTLVISLIALAVSSIFAVRQINAAHHANQLPIINDILREVRSSKFLREEQLLWQKLPALRSDVRFSHLPEDLREAAYDVCFAYLMVAYLVSLKIIDRRLAILPIHYRIIRTWDAVAPLVVEERRHRGDELSFLNLLESFVEFVRRQDIQSIVDEVNTSFK
jgi:hypothetical protein